MSSDWQSAEPHDQRGGGSRAREAAEALFKPQRPRGPAGPLAPTRAAADPVGAEPLASRQPRVFTTAPAPASEARRSRASMTPIAQPRPPTKRRETATIAKAELGRIRALVHYGMTPEQVAELYGVPSTLIERIATATPGEG